MNLRFARFASITFCCLVIVVGLAQAQPGYEKFVPTPAYLEAYDLISQAGSRPVAVQKFLAIARANPRTTLGAQCLFDAAYYSESLLKSKPIYDEIATVYAGTAFAVYARKSIYILQNGSKSDLEQVGGLDQLIVGLGGPSLAEIVRRPTLSLQRLRQLEENYAEAVADLYLSQVNILIAIKRFDEALALAKFGKELMQGNDHLNAQFDILISRTYIKKFKIPTPLGDFKSVPIYLKLSLSDNERRCSRPLVRGEAHTGDFLSRQVYWEDCTVTLDGVDIKGKLNLVYNYPKKLKPGKVFEELKFTYQPSQPLTPGRHVLYVKLRTALGESGPVAEQTRTFFVDRSIRDDRDDDDDEQDRRRRHERDD